MIRILLALILSIVAAAASWAILESTYDHDSFASEEAQASLEVTEEQTAELLASRKKSDMIAFGIFGSLLGLVCGVACGSRIPIGRAAIGAVTGLLLGGGAGVAGAWLGHWHDANISFPPDPMLYWFVRWIAILLPIGIACGVVAQLTTRSSNKTDAIIGGVLGAAVAVLLYCLSNGALTRLENHQSVFPTHPENRALIFGLSAVCISLAITLQLRRHTPKEDDQSASNEEIQAN